MTDRKLTGRQGTNRHAISLYGLWTGLPWLTVHFLGVSIGLTKVGTHPASVAAGQVFFHL